MKVVAIPVGINVHYVDRIFIRGDVENQTLKAVQGELNGVKKHNEALIIFGKFGIKSQQIFDILGYKVKWNGLDPENAEIVKI